MSRFLNRAAEVTSNITVILDYCHIHRIAQDPYHPGAQIKAAFMFESKDQIERKASLNLSPSVLCIAAADANEFAWEYMDETGRFVSIFTKCLVIALREARGQEVAWCTTIGRVRELMSSVFPSQRPDISGPDSRLLFSTNIIHVDHHTVFMHGEQCIIRAGRAAGVREGNVYLVMPLEFERADARHRLCRAEVVAVTGARSTVKILDHKKVVPRGGARAFLETEALYRWPVAFPDGDKWIYGLLRNSKYLRPCSLDDNEVPLLRISKEVGRLQMSHRSGTLLATQPDKYHHIFGEIIVEGAEIFARGQNLLTLKKGRGQAMLEESLHIVATIVDEGLFVRNLWSEGDAEVWEGETIHVSLEPRGSHMVHTAIFEVSPTGNVTLITPEDETRIHDRTDQADQDPVQPVWDISWPESVPKHGTLAGTLVFIVTNEPVDLRHLDTEFTHSLDYTSCRNNLEFITFHLASGVGRPVHQEHELPAVDYSVVRLPFTLHPRKDS
ncbi:hypothetical protein FDECE_18114 [Fusarium decemcellulare]|nr:hypothetical protein FDECE_18114 [Fusarium decemcellulare]